MKSISWNYMLQVRLVSSLALEHDYNSLFTLPGTAQGDPTEANWVGAEFKRDEDLILGSVKGNIGYVSGEWYMPSMRTHTTSSLGISRYALSLPRSVKFVASSNEGSFPPM